MTLLIGTKELNIITNDVGPKGWCDSICCVKHCVINGSTLLYVLESLQVFIIVIYYYIAE